MGQKPTRTPHVHTSRRFVIIALFTLLVSLPLATGLLYLVTTTYHFVRTDARLDVENGLAGRDATPPFPLGVNPEEKQITEQGGVEAYLETHISKIDEPEEERKTSFLRKTVAKLALFDWYQNLAAGGSRILIIEPGERREQIAAHFAKILNWTEDEKRAFLTSIVSSDPVLLEGKFIPGSYMVVRGARAHEVAPLIIDRFNTEILSRYSAAVAASVPLSDTLTIASLLEREAYDFDDMRYIAGVIWNRLFIDMNLQIDATLQYAKGEKSLKTWWPNPIPEDKYIDSPYNTYKNGGLPPTPIANPSPDAILAALNPRKTECLYYFHDREGGFHCTATYKEHVALLKEYYGRGK